MRDNKQRTQEDNKQRGDENDGQNLPDPLFREFPFIRPLSRKGQLDTMMRYVQMNPQRLATKRLMPGYFRVQEGIEIAGRTYRGVGNAALLQAERFAPVHVRRTMVDEAEHGDNKRLREYMNGCVLAARKGAVMVSPFISPRTYYSDFISATTLLKLCHSKSIYYPTLPHAANCCSAHTTDNCAFATGLWRNTIQRL